MPRGKCSVTSPALRATSDLLDGQLAFHAALAVARHGAVERVLAGLEVDRHLGGAVLDDRALLIDAVAQDGDVVVDALLVLGGDLDVAGLGGRVGVLEGEARGGDRDVERPVLLLGRSPRLLCARGGEPALVLTRLAGGEGNVR